MTHLGTLGVSVDIGTSNITLHLINLETSEIRHEMIIDNAQRKHGEEIISRMDYARNRNNALKLTTIVRQSISNTIREMLADSRYKKESVKSVTIVGNTAMHHLFFDLPTDSLLRPPYKAEFKDSISTSASSLLLPFDSDTECYSPPVIESYVGPDAIAMMIASGFPDSEKNTVSIDVGTNTEIAVLKEGRIWIASAASGPAFEGMSIQCGMPGEIGAIHSVEVDSSISKPRYEVVGAGMPRGICGTGIVSAISSMLDAGILLPRGSFNRTISSPWLELGSPIVYYIIVPSQESMTGSAIVISQPDVRMIQQSKAAIRGAFELLLEQAGLKSEDIQQLNLTGIFGSGLSVEAAIRIGLIPELPGAEIHQIPGGAIKGADLLHSMKYREIASHIASTVTHVNLIDNPDFKTKFSKSIGFPSR
ncbi:MAG: ASKHA domain-containing protein [Promethearchaeota archaeon]